MCKALTKKGTQCKKKPPEGSDYCYLHKPAPAIDNEPKVYFKAAEISKCDDKPNRTINFINPFSGVPYVVVQEETFETFKTQSKLFSGIIDKNSIHTMNIRCNCQTYIDDIDRLKLQHNRKYESMDKQILTIKKKYNKLKSLYSESLKNVNRLKTTLKDSNKKNNALELKLSTEKKRNNTPSKILSDFALLDEFINTEIEKATGRTRDYKKHVYNSINDFIGIHNAQQILNRYFQNVSVDDFRDLFVLTRDNRISIAHPKVELPDYEKIERIKTLLNFSYKTT